MRARRVRGGLTVNAVAGSHVVFLAFDVAEALRPGLRGFAVRRFDAKQQETVWLRGMKTFESLEPHPAPGETFATNRHPVQGFQWADYAVEPGVAYRYTVQALAGPLDALSPRAEVAVGVTTELERGARHGVVFNRGSVATQEYARRFQNMRPADAGPAAYAWLSRGLVESIVAFVGRAKSGWSVHGAFYEFQWPAVIDALADARRRGADVQILFDDTPGATTPARRNRDAIDAAGAGAFCRGRAAGRLMHHKFIVLGRAGKARAVLTGSTNLTENGLFGHANLAHVVEDDAVAQAYRDCWERLAADPPVGAAYRADNEAASPAPPRPWRAAVTPVFSPRGTDLAALDWYAEIAGSAAQALMMTFAFGMHEKFRAVYGRDDAVLRIALMEREGTGANLAAQRRAIAALRRRPNVLVAVGNRIVTNAFDRWLAEMDRVRKEPVNVHWVHTKFMLVDPLGESPVVVTGSANFSAASTDTNDENMLVIRGDRRVADIYFGEFMRLYAHHAFRESVKRFVERGGDATKDWRPQYLDATDAWVAPYFDPAEPSARFARRAYFAGAIAV